MLLAFNFWSLLCVKVRTDLMVIVKVSCSIQKKMRALASGMI